MEQVFIWPVKWQLGSPKSWEHAIRVRWQVLELQTERFMHNKNWAE